MAPIKQFIVATLSALSSSLLFAGDVTGTVHAEPKPGAESADNAAGAYGSRKYKFVERVDYSQMRDFVVYIEGPAGTNMAPATNVASVITSRVAQKSATFFPHVLPVLAGTTVEWPNNDDIYHNVFSDSDAARFDLGLYKTQTPQVTFSKPGKVDVYCSIHANMHCIVLVMENPYFTTTDADGKYTITNVPPGVYKLKAWHERLPSEEQEVVVPTNGTVKANFVLNKNSGQH
jgi:plastocyanin